MPKISIIIPVYNAEQYLEECLLSISQQTFTDFEIWAINDGSKDRSLEILKKHQEKEPRLHILSQKNKGVSAARNLGLENASGDFITFVDADDTLPNDAFSEIISVSSVDLLMGSFVTKRNQKPFPSINLPKTYTEKENLIADFITWKLKIRLGSFYVKRSIVTMHQLRFSELYKYAEDVHFITRCLYYAESNRVTDKVLYEYCLRENSAITQYGYERFHSYLAKKELYEFFTQKAQFTSVEKIYLGYQLPEAIIDVVELLCQNGHSMRKILPYLRNRQFLNAIEEKNFNEYTPSQIKDKIILFKKNPYYFCFYNKIKITVGGLKSKIYALFYK